MSRLLEFRIVSNVSLIIYWRPNKVRSKSTPCLIYHQPINLLVHEKSEEQNLACPYLDYYSTFLMKRQTIHVKMNQNKVTLIENTERNWNIYQMHLINQQQRNLETCTQETIQA
jgi:hypothetical protein